MKDLTLKACPICGKVPAIHAAPLRDMEPKPDDPFWLTINNGRVGVLYSITCHGVSSDKFTGLEAVAHSWNAAVAAHLTSQKTTKPVNAMNAWCVVWANGDPLLDTLSTLEAHTIERAERRFMAQWPDLEEQGHRVVEVVVSELSTEGPTTSDGSRSIMVDCLRSQLSKAHNQDDVVAGEIVHLVAKLVQERDEAVELVGKLRQKHGGEILRIANAMGLTTTAYLADSVRALFENHRRLERALENVRTVVDDMEER